MTQCISVQSTAELNILKTGINNMLDKISHRNKQLTDYARLDPLTGIIDRLGGFLLWMKLELRLLISPSVLSL